MHHYVHCDITHSGQDIKNKQGNRGYPYPNKWYWRGYPSIEDRIKKMCYVYQIEYHSAIRRQNTATNNNIDQPSEYYAKQNKSVGKS